MNLRADVSAGTRFPYDRRVVVLLARASETGARVVICARRSDQRIVTSDLGDLRVLDPGVQLITL
jgi:hypothetical protein